MRKFCVITPMGIIAFNQLGLPVTATVTDVDDAWKTLRSEHHPDRGGNLDRFDAICKAHKEARFWALEPKACPACEGSGKRQGRGDILLNCRECNGSGIRS